jgi:hypothetical protein
MGPLFVNAIACMSNDKPRFANANNSVVLRVDFDRAAILVSVTWRSPRFAT